MFSINFLFNFNFIQFTFSFFSLDHIGKIFQYFYQHDGNSCLYNNIILLLIVSLNINSCTHAVEHLKWGFSNFLPKSSSLDCKIGPFIRMLFERCVLNHINRTSLLSSYLDFRIRLVKTILDS